MEASSKLEALKRQRAILQAKRDDLVMDHADKYVPSDASAQRILEEIAPINDQISALDQKILRISPRSILKARAELLQATLDGKGSADIRADRDLATAMFDRAADKLELSRRSRTRKTVLRVIALVALALLVALAQFAKKG